MPDYDLSRLSSRSFEQLIQSLAIKYIAPGAIIFGDGPDGGREASYDGEMQYRSAQKSWNGYLVAQAKFRQRPEGTTSDGRWARAQLDGELKKFTDAKLKLRKPQYYLFCTNVVLSSLARKGAKDRAFAILRSAGKKVNLKGFDIWDYDKLRSMLDDAADIRRAYAAWITPGDVLLQAMKSIAPKPDFTDVMATFLQRELLEDQHVNLRQAGHLAEQEPPMAQVFIDLAATAEPSPEPPKEDSESETLPAGFVSELIRIGDERLPADSPGLDWVPMKISLSPPGGWGQTQAWGVQRPIKTGDRWRFSNPQVGRYVLVGGPGQGKTTVGQFVCQLYRTAILGDFSKPMAQEVRNALSELQTQSDRGIQLPRARRFPLRIVLNDFATALASNKPDSPTSVLSYIARLVHLRTDREVSVDDLRKWLNEYAWFIVLDGLDEVPSSTNRDAVLKAIRDFWVEIPGADVLVLATTRPQGYSDDFSPEYYHHLHLAPLSVPRALAYGERLAAALYPRKQDRRAALVSYLRQAAAIEATARLMRSPLQVTIMSNLVDLSGKPPQERWRLFDKYFEVIYDREMQRNIPASDILREYRTSIVAIHRLVGLRLQIESEKPGQTSARLPVRDLHRLVNRYLKKKGFQGPELAGLEEKIIEAAGDRLVFLVGVRQGQVGFEIRSLQEFFAAEALTDGPDRRVTKHLRVIASAPHWRNVFLFVAAKYNSDREDMQTQIAGICAQLNAGPDDAYRLTLVGSQLALDILADFVAERQPNHARTLAELAWKLADRPHSEIHKRLAACYSPAVEPIYRQELSKRLSLDVDKVGNGAWMVALWMIQEGNEWVTELADASWPPTPESQIEILFHWDSREESWWASSKLAGLVPRMRVEMLGGIQGLPWIRDREGAPTRLSSAAAAMNPSPQSPAIWLQLPGFNDRAIAVNPMWLGEAKSLFDALLEVKPQCQSWQWPQAVVQFANNPSAATLADALEELATGWPEAVDVSEIAAWPIASCLEAANNANELRQLAEGCRKGKLGNLSDWLGQERIWQTEGIDITQLLSKAETHLGNEPPWLNCPPPGMRTYRVGRASARFAMQVFTLLPKSPRRWAADLACTALFPYQPELPQIAEPQTYIEGLEIALRLASNVDSEMLSFIQSGFSEAQFIGLAKLVGARCEVPTPVKPTSDAADWVTDLQKKDPLCGDLIPVLCCWALGDPDFSIGVDLDKLKPVGKVQEASVLLLRIAKTDAPADASALGTAIAQISQPSPQYVGLAARLIEARHAGTPFAEQFAAQLYQQLSPIATENRNLALGILEDYLRRRTSGLEKPAATA